RGRRGVAGLPRGPSRPVCETRVPITVSRFVVVGGHPGPGEDSRMSNPVQLCLLGRFEISVRGRAAMRWHPTKARALFALLLVNAGSRVSKGRLEELLWPDPRRPAGPTALKVAVHGLRRELDCRIGSDRRCLHIDHCDGGYRLTMGAEVTVDF